MKKRTVWWKVMAVAAVTLTGGGMMAAQAAKGFATRAQIGLVSERIQKQLNLTDDQRVRVRDILQEAIPKGIAIHDDMKVDAKTRRTQLKKLHDTTKARIYALLTPAQRKEADRVRGNLMTMGRQKMEEIAGQLKLTPAQRARVQPILAKRFKEGIALRDNMNLTVGQKFARAMELRKNTRAEINEILSAEQSAKLDKILSNMRTEAHRRFGALRDPR